MADGLEYFLEEILNAEEDDERSFLEPNGLTAEEISQIPANSEIPAGEQCCICLSEFEENVLTRQLICNHFFHEECLLPWLEINITCPLCRRRLTDRQNLADFVDDWVNASSDSEVDEAYLIWTGQPVPPRRQVPSAPATGFGFPVPPVQISDLAETVGSLSMSDDSNQLGDDNFNWTDSFDEFTDDCSGNEMSDFQSDTEESPMDISLAVNTSINAEDLVVPLPSDENLNPTWLQLTENGQLVRVEFDMNQMQPVRENQISRSVSRRITRSRSPLDREETPSTSQSTRRSASHRRN